MKGYPLARDMRDKITVQRRSVSISALGGQLGAWNTLIASRAAKIIPLKPLRRGGEEVVADREQATILYEMWIRWDSETSQITTDDRVIDLRDPSKIFKLRFVEDLDRRKVWLTIQAERGVADG
jgi:head-tail adaptor